MSQSDLSTYGLRSAPAFEGMLYDASGNLVDSLTATAATPFGAPLAQGASDELAKVVSVVPSDRFVGVALHTHVRENNTVSPDGYLAGDRMSVLRKGRVWVPIVGAFTKEAPVYVTATGTYTATVGSNIKVGKFLTSGSGRLAPIEVNVLP